MIHWFTGIADVGVLLGGTRSYGVGVAEIVGPGKCFVFLFWQLTLHIIVT